MTKSSLFNKFSPLIRPFVGGLISALAAEIGVLLSFRVDSLFWTGVYLPVFVLDPHSYEFRIVFILVFWFLIGTIVASLTRKNLAAIGIWLLLYMVCFVIAFLLIFTT